MLVQNSVYRNTYLTDGVNKDFYFSFPILEASQVLVQTSAVTNTETVTTVDPGQYTVIGVGQTTGGHISFTTAPPTGSRLALTLNIPITQLYQYAELDSFPAKSHEDALAKLTLICQQLKEQISRAVLISATSESSTADFIASLYAARDSATASAAAADLSATSAGASATAAQQTAVDAAANSAGLITEVQNLSAMCTGKANNDLNNLTSTGTTAIAHYAMPDTSRTISISMPASTGGTVTAPADGILCFDARSTAVNGGISLRTGNYVRWSFAPLAEWTVTCDLSVAKGAVVTVAWNTASGGQLLLVRAKGSQ